MSDKKELKDSTGKLINPHIPNYMSQVPWYHNNSSTSKSTSLDHQKSNLHINSIESTIKSEWYERGANLGTANKYRKGACENCGSMTHDKKNCLSRPRKKGAKFTNSDIQPDEVISDIKLNFEGKRDRWNGYDNSDYKKSIESWERMESIRKKKKAEELAIKKAEKLAKGETVDSDTSDSDDSSEDEMKDGGEVISHVDDKTKQTVRNLRIREDTSKFLLNIYSDTYFDPKTRSMRGNPFPDQDPNSLVYAGDNFVRSSGDTQKFNQLESFSWEAADHGKNIHIAANPSLAEKMYQQHKQMKEDAINNTKKTILEKYGGSEHLKSNNTVAQAESYVEFAPDGRIVKGLDIVIPKSKYIEGQLDGNHTQIWGSFWKEGQWGYGCCQNTIKNSYCLGSGNRDDKEKSNKRKIEAV